MHFDTYSIIYLGNAVCPLGLGGWQMGPKFSANKTLKHYLIYSFGPDTH